MRPNRERGELEIRVDGHVFTWRLEVWACIALEEATGHALASLIAQINQGRVQSLRACIWAALQARHAAAYPSPEAAGAFMDALGGHEATMALVRELFALNGDDRPQREAKPDPRARKRRTSPGSLWRQFYVQLRAGGLSGDAFWRLSLRELYLELAADQERKDRDLSQAWYIANLVWAKQMPSLDRLLDREEAGGQQTWQEMKATLLAITGAQSRTTH